MTAPTSTPLIDTRVRSDAILCGYDGPTDPLSTTDGLILYYYPATQANPAYVDIITGQSSIQLVGPEIRQVMLALQTAVNRGTAPLKDNGQ